MDLSMVPNAFACCTLGDPGPSVVDLLLPAAPGSKFRALTDRASLAVDGLILSIGGSVAVGLGSSRTAGELLLSALAFAAGWVLDTQVALLHRLKISLVVCPEPSRLTSSASCSASAVPSSTVASLVPLAAALLAGAEDVLTEAEPRDDPRSGGGLAKGGSTVFL